MFVHIIIMSRQRRQQHNLFLLNMVRLSTGSRATTQRLAWAAPMKVIISALVVLCVDHPRSLLPCDAAAAFTGNIIIAPSPSPSLASSSSSPAFATVAVTVDRNRRRRLPVSRPSLTSVSLSAAETAATASLAESGGYGDGGGGTTTTASRLKRTAAFMEWARENGIK